jgi:hypothetical protein
MYQSNRAATDVPQASGAARRSEIRMPVRLPGTLTPLGGDGARIQVADLSRGGACCRVSKALPPGTEVDLALEGLSVRAVVCWASGGLVGLRFGQQLRASDILIQSRRSRCGDAPDRPFHHAATGRSLRRAG